MPKQTRKREVGSYVIWEPDDVGANLSYTSKIAHGAVGVIVTINTNGPGFQFGNAQVDFDHGMPGKHICVYWCRATDLRVISEKDFHIFRAIEALKVGA